MWRSDHSLDFYKQSKKLQKWALLETRVLNKTHRFSATFLVSVKPNTLKLALPGLANHKSALNSTVDT